MPEDSSRDEPLKFNIDDVRHIGEIPESEEIDPDSDAGQYLPPQENERNHSYLNKEERPDGTIVYYYGNGVKAIHHPSPKKSPISYHQAAFAGHTAEANRVLAANPEMARAHMEAAGGHLLASSIKSSASNRAVLSSSEKRGNKQLRRDRAIVEQAKRAREAADDSSKKPDKSEWEVLGHGAKRRRTPSRSTQLNKFISFIKEGDGGAVDGVGTVAVSSDPGSFTETYGGRKDSKKKRSGVDKLDSFLRETSMQKFATTLVKEVTEEFRKEDDELEKLAVLARIGAAAAGSKLMDEVLENEDVEKAGSDLPRQAVTQEPAKPAKTKTEETPVKSSYESTDKEFEKFHELFKDYFEYLEAEDEDDSRDSEEGTDSEKESGSDMD